MTRELFVALGALVEEHGGPAVVGALVAGCGSAADASDRGYTKDWHAAIAFLQSAETRVAEAERAGAAAKMPVTLAMGLDLCAQACS